MPKEPPSALNKAMALLAIRPLSERELLEKLRKAGFPDRECDDAIAECVRRRYLDDDQLTEDAVAALRQRNGGAAQIRLRLRRRGLDAEKVSTLLDADREEEIAAARRAAEGKLRLLARESDPRKKREKLFRFMIARGFAPGVVMQVIGDGE